MIKHDWSDFNEYQYKAMVLLHFFYHIQDFKNNIVGPEMRYCSCRVGVEYREILKQHGIETLESDVYYD